MNSDKDVWGKSLQKIENAGRFDTKPGGPNAKPLPKRELFKSPKEKKLIERVKNLEEQVDKLITELRKVKKIAIKRKPKNENYD